LTYVRTHGAPKKISTDYYTTFRGHLPMPMRHDENIASSFGFLAPSSLFRHHSGKRPLRAVTLAPSSRTDPLNHQYNTAKMTDEQFKIVVTEDSVQSWWESDQIEADRLAVMLAQENTHYAPFYDYISSYNDYENNNEYVNESWRRKICEWAYEVVDFFTLDREVVSIAMNFLDRAISSKARKTNSCVPRKHFQLVAVTSLYLAIKLHGETDTQGEFHKVRIDAFVELGRGMFTIETLEAMELSILSMLHWHVNPPTVVSFVTSLLRLLPESCDDQPLHTTVASGLFEMARYLTELSVCVSSISFYFKPSEIAFAVILCAIDALQESVPLSFGARTALLDSIAKATTLRPNKKSIRKICSLIMELAPILFPQTEEQQPSRAKKLEQLPSYKFTSPPPEPGLSRNTSVSSDGGTGSPVCVTEHLSEFISESLDTSVSERVCKRPRLS